MVGEKMQHRDRALLVYPRRRVHRLDEVDSERFIDRGGLDREERPLDYRRAAGRHLDAKGIDPVAAQPRARKMKAGRGRTMMARGSRTSHEEMDGDLVRAVDRAREAKSAGRA